MKKHLTHHFDFYCLANYQKSSVYRRQFLFGVSTDADFKFTSKVPIIEEQCGDQNTKTKQNKTKQNKNNKNKNKQTNKAK